ncbi:hypothetical protein GGS23DRAFT_584690 [Durotheca rogersii]|uniref:uncharacterized protein n=1 Tax=Durotheca rogersii TaxID=419775 RepID=UPI002220F272|nr:uncharacterized protein GGS23DRAFT_584690 [Durotheca rogersii]KAI5859684.1 hypothetical protein GGS23DRAFT_584690 [Durotheca rogersii]
MIVGLVPVRGPVAVPAVMAVTGLLFPAGGALGRPCPTDSDVSGESSNLGGRLSEQDGCSRACDGGWDCDWGWGRDSDGGGGCGGSDGGWADEVWETRFGLRMAGECLRENPLVSFLSRYLRSVNAPPVGHQPEGTRRAVSTAAYPRYGPGRGVTGQSVAGRGTGLGEVRARAGEGTPRMRSVMYPAPAYEGTLCTR